MLRPTPERVGLVPLRREADPRTALDAKALRGRGWTTSLIGILLGTDGDLVGRDTEGFPVAYYDAERVAEAEAADPALRARVAQVAK